MVEVEDYLQTGKIDLLFGCNRAMVEVEAEGEVIHEQPYRGLQSGYG